MKKITVLQGYSMSRPSDSSPASQRHGSGNSQATGLRVICQLPSRVNYIKVAPLPNTEDEHIAKIAEGRNDV